MFVLQAQLVLLQSHPPYLKKCIHSLKLSTWDPHVSDEYIESLEHVCFLLKETKADDVSMRAAHSTDNLHILASNVIHGMLPVGLGKKEFLKLLQHENAILRALGADVAHCVLERIEKQFDQALRIDRLNTEGALVEAIGEILPDFTTFFNARTR